MSGILLTRDSFREAIFARDSHRCVICGAPGQDAHHILERRLFSDSGYYLENGATLCGTHHLLAESTELSCDEIRKAAGITEVVLPPHLYPDVHYDKWGNEILSNGTRFRGELFEDESVQKVLQPVLHLFLRYIKYPRTWHLPWSPGATKDDRMLPEDTAHLMFDKDELVVTEKMDGENTNMYRDYIHARSAEYTPHPTRDRVKALWASISYDIPEGWRICGENLYAERSIGYDALPDIFLVFNIWNDRNACLGWDETVEWAHLLGLQTVPVLKRGICDDIQEWTETLVGGLNISKQEGFVVRYADRFEFREFRESVAKWVRPEHVQTHGGWMRSKFKLNKVVKP